MGRKILPPPGSSENRRGFARGQHLVHRPAADDDQARIRFAPGNGPERREG